MSKDNDFGDLPLDEIVEMMKGVLADDPTALVFQKWTCPNCGERVVSNTPNAVHTGGMRHDDCGHVYKGDQFGMMVIYSHQRLTKSV